MQRLFSAFPASWPGAGLLLLRVVVAAPLIVDAVHPPFQTPHGTQLVTQLLGFGTGGCLVAGVWTPVAAVVEVALQLWRLSWRLDTNRTALMLAAVGVSLIMLGPGAWSVDARRFGRKRIDVETR